MGGLSDHARAARLDFGRHWFGPLVAVLLRAVHEPALAFDLATETMAAASTAWDEPPEDEQAVADLLRLAARTLEIAAERAQVPAVERRRHRQPAPLPLTISQQREIMALAEAQIELPEAARDAADELFRTAPPRQALEQIRPSGLIDAEHLPQAKQAQDER